MLPFYPVGLGGLQGSPLFRKVIWNLHPLMKDADHFICSVIDYTGK